jgi:hypothetical protein
MEKLPHYTLQIIEMEKLPHYTAIWKTNGKTATLYFTNYTNGKTATLYFSKAETSYVSSEWKDGRLEDEEEDVGGC